MTLKEVPGGYAVVNEGNPELYWGCHFYGTNSTIAFFPFPWLFIMGLFVCRVLFIYASEQRTAGGWIALFWRFGADRCDLVLLLVALTWIASLACYFMILTPVDPPSNCIYRDGEIYDISTETPCQTCCSCIHFMTKMNQFACGYHECGGVGGLCWHDGRNRKKNCYKFLGEELIPGEMYPTDDYPDCKYPGCTVEKKLIADKQCTLMCYDEGGLGFREAGVNTLVVWPWHNERYNYTMSLPKPDVNVQYALGGNMVACTLLFLLFTNCCSHRPRFYRKASISEPNTAKVQANELDDEETDLGDEEEYSAYTSDPVSPLKREIKSPQLALQDIDLAVSSPSVMHSPQLAVPSSVKRQVERELAAVDAGMQQPSDTLVDKKQRVHRRLEAARLRKQQAEEEGIIPVFEAESGVPQVLSPMGSKDTMEIDDFF